MPTEEGVISTGIALCLAAPRSTQTHASFDLRKSTMAPAIVDLLFVATRSWTFIAYLISMPEFLLCISSFTRID